MNNQQASLHAEMGIGPLWKLRRPEPDALPSASEIVIASSASGLIRVADLPVNASDVAAPETVPAIAMAPDVFASACRDCGLSERDINTLREIRKLRLDYVFIDQKPLEFADGDKPDVCNASRILRKNMLQTLVSQVAGNMIVFNLINTNEVASVSTVEEGVAVPWIELTVALAGLKALLKLLQPSVIVSLGRIAAASLLGLQHEASSGSLQRQLGDMDGLPVVVTYHPLELLQNPKEKAQAWSDLCSARNFVPVS
ncbi:hypothetical protein BH11PSE12_BH11PSE12_18720 [soil metagenome]